jgi:hypothetical protein
MLAPRTGWGLADIAVLRGWDERLATDFSDQAWQFRLEWLKRGAWVIALAVPATFALHLGFWALLLVAYPRSVRVQTHIFYNPLARKILGLGYVDILLTWIPFLRRRLFDPFRDPLAGDTDRVGPADRDGNYYPKSEVAVLQRLELERGIRESEQDALAGTLAGSAGSVVWALAACAVRPSCSARRGAERQATFGTSWAPTPRGDFHSSISVPAIVGLISPMPSVRASEAWVATKI